MEMHPIVTVPHDPIAVAELTAVCIRADARQGSAVALSPDALYIEDPSRGPNMLLSPAEVSARGGGQCFDLTRAEGAFRGTHIGCCRTPAGFHVWLAFLKSDGPPMIYDISKLRGMPDSPEYDGAAYVPIWQPPPGTVGPPGYDVPPSGVVGASMLPADAWADFVTTTGRPLVAGANTPDALYVAVKREFDASTGSRHAALAAILLCLRANVDPRTRDAVIAQLRDIGPSMSTTSAQIVGAIGLLKGRPWRSLVPAAAKPVPRACPGSCSAPKV